MSNRNFSNIKVLGVIQARMGSTRLKEKALRKILDKTLTEHIFERLKASKELDGIVLATSTNEENDALEEESERLGLPCFRGSEKDLVSRHLEAVEKYGASAMVRVTGDCPLADPELLDKMVRFYKENPDEFDLVTNIFPRTFPDGLDLEILPLSTLERLQKEVKDPFYRESLTLYIMDNPDKFRIYNFKNSEDLSKLRWTVDYESDLEFVKKIYEGIYPEKKIFTMEDIINHLKK